METRSIPIEGIGTDFSCYRLSSPARVSAMERSLSSSGQLYPVVVRLHQGAYQLLDGFKRYYAACSLDWKELECRVVDADTLSAKVMILLYNSSPGSLQDYEQAQIIHSLRKDHLLSCQEIARLTGKSMSWVSRRLSFIERLDESAVTHLKLGKITSTHARELSRLPRGKQKEFLQVIIGENLTSRETGLLARKYLCAKSAQEEKYLVSHPRQVIEQALLAGDISDSRLSLWGNRLLKTTRMLAHQQHIFIGQSRHLPPGELTSNEKEVLVPGFISLGKDAQMMQTLLKPYCDEG